MRNQPMVEVSEISKPKQRVRYWWVGALLSATVGLLWLGWVAPPRSSTKPQPDTVRLATITTATDTINGPAALAMNSSLFHYTDSWQVDATGADPDEPADPWQEPAGRLSFAYRGSDLALLLAPGDYWGYLYVTVDGAPANLLSNLPGNRNVAGEATGYRTFYAPEAVVDGASVAQWIPVHHAADSTAIHTVEVEVWRSWGQKPIRGVAIDTLLAQQWPRWPGVGLLLLSGWLLWPALRFSANPSGLQTLLYHLLQWAYPWLLPRWARPIAPAIAGSGLLLLGLAIAFSTWPVALAGMLLLAWAGLQRPVLWIAALLLGLPFYFSFALPLLPGHSIGLIDLGVLGGIVISAAHWLLQWAMIDHMARRISDERLRRAIGYLLAALISWALLATVQATHQAVAWHEWRTLFFYAGLFGITLWLTMSRQPVTTSQRGDDTLWLTMSGRPVTTEQRRNDQTLLLGAWLAGSTMVALVALWQYGSGTLLIQAEGVERVRAFYGSPNNLALYLERTLAVGLAGALFARHNRWRWLCLTTSVIQGAALLLTFSKGALLLGLPAILAVLWLGGFVLLRRRGESRRVLWWLAGIAAIAVIPLLPFLATERFQRLLDFEQGTGFVRLQLWRSSWQMALDHPWFGVGPDNFLYAYRSLYLLPAAWAEPNLNHPHNWLLDWWTRIGVAGLLLAISWFGLLVWRQWRHVQKGDHPVVALGLLAATVAALTHGLIDTSYALPDLMLVWVLMSYLPISSE